MFSSCPLGIRNRCPADDRPNSGRAAEGQRGRPQRDGAPDVRKSGLDRQKWWPQFQPEPASGVLLEIQMVRLAIGSWVVDEATDTIERGSERLKLERRTMATLIHLAERPNAVVPREELLDAIWPNVIVSDH